MSGRLVLITRPRPQAEATAREVEALGHKCLLAPLLEIQPVEFTLPRPAPAYQGIVLTSMQAVRALTRTGVHPACPLFVVGETLAAGVRAAGFENIKAVAMNARDLAGRIAPDAGPYLYLRGVDTAFDLAGDVRRRGIECDFVIVYEARAAAAFPPEALAAFEVGAVRAVTLHSVRSAQIFCTLYAPLQGRDIKVLCFGESVLEYVRSYGLACEAYASAAPTSESFLSLLRAHL